MNALSVKCGISISPAALCDVLLLLLLVTNLQIIDGMKPSRAPMKSCHRRQFVGNYANVFCSMSSNSDINDDPRNSWMQQSGNSYSSNKDDAAPRRSRLADRIRQLDMAMHKSESVEIRTPVDATDISKSGDDFSFQAKQGIFQIKSAEQHTYVGSYFDLTPIHFSG